MSMGDEIIDVYRIEIEKPADREVIAAILVKNGYTVRLARQKKSNTGNTYRWFVEFWRD